MEGKRQLKSYFYVLAFIYFLFGIGFFLYYNLGGQRIEGSVASVYLERTESFGSRLRPPQVKSMTMRFPGFQITHSFFSPLLVTTADGLSHRLPIERVEQRGDQGWRLSFKGGLSLLVETIAETQRVIFTAKIPLLRPHLTHLSFPLEAQKGFKISSEEEPSPLVRSFSEQSDKDSEYLLLLPENARYLQKEGRVSIPVKHGELSFVSKSGTQLEGESLAVWFSQSNDRISEGQMRRQQAHILDEAYTYWLERYNIAEPPERSSSRAKEALSFILAEALSRGEFATWKARLEKEGVEGHSVAPFLGDIVAKGEAFVDRRGKFLADTKKALVNEPTFFVRLHPLSLVSSDLDLLKEVQFTARHFSNKISPKEAINRLRFLADPLGGLSSEIGFAQNRLIEEIISPNIRWVKGKGLFVFTPNYEIDVEKTLEVGRIFRSLGHLQDNHQVVGEKLVFSTLRLIRKDGTLPRTVGQDYQGNLQGRGTLYPSEYYPLITENRHLVKEVVLGAPLAKNSWAWTVASEMRLSGDEREVDLVFQYPRGETHYLVISGVESFTEIHFRGLKWEERVDLENQQSGWVYKRHKKLLFAKIHHESKTERIRLLYH